MTGGSRGARFSLLCHDCTLAELTMIRDQLLLLRGKLFKNA